MERDKRIQKTFRAKVIEVILSGQSVGQHSTLTLADNTRSLFDTPLTIVFASVVYRKGSFGS
jgi:hypothetical protein